MNKSFEEQLEKLRLPDIELRRSQQVFKKALLTNPPQKLSFIRQLLKGGERYKMNRNILVFSAAGLIVIAMFLGITALNFLPKSAQVQAKDLVDRMIIKMSDLTPEQRKEIETRIQADMKESLEEAKAAKDLTIVPESEINRMDKPAMGGKVGFMVFKKDTDDENAPKKDIFFEKKVASSGEPAPLPGITVPKGIKVLSYTDSKGRKVLLGVDENDKPVMKMIRIEKGQMPDPPAGFPGIQGEAGEKIFIHKDTE
jgi:hypothetical protein